MQKENVFILAILVKNEAGVLNRVTSLFARRGYNIDTLSVGETEQENVSRITVTARGTDRMRRQILTQTEKLEDVITAGIIDGESAVLRELMLIKISADSTRRSEILAAVSVFRAKVVDMTPQSLTMEITGERGKCDAFVEYLKPFGIAELCRTGITAMTRGQTTLTNG